MKDLLLLRHAKSSWKEPDLDDHDRPLNKRGRNDAPRMGHLLEREGLIPDCIVSSTALRARATAERVAEACGYAGELHVTRRLYLAGVADFLRLLREAPAECRSLMLVGHNPGIEELVRHLGGKSETMPTAALARIALPIERWAELEDGVRGELLGLWRPKELAD